jgi:hypothetical protein
MAAWLRVLIRIWPGTLLRKRDCRSGLQSSRSTPASFYRCWLPSWSGSHSRFAPHRTNTASCAATSPCASVLRCASLASIGLRVRACARACAPCTRAPCDLFPVVIILSLCVPRHPSCVAARLVLTHVFILCCPSVHRSHSRVRSRRLICRNPRLAETPGLPRPLACRVMASSQPLHSTFIHVMSEIFNPKLSSLA